MQGPVADAGNESFVGYWQTPIRHGMTIGELAKMFNAERAIHAKLTVVTMEGWMRGDWFDSTGVPWINPSPNMRSLNEATLYPGIGMIEATNISVGRGTDTPFEVVGAPWIIDKLSNIGPLSQRPRDQRSSLRPISFTPIESNYANQLCGGVNIVVTDRNALDAPELGLKLSRRCTASTPINTRSPASTRLMRQQGKPRCQSPKAKTRAALLSNGRMKSISSDTIRSKYLHLLKICRHTLQHEGALNEASHKRRSLLSGSLPLSPSH